MGDEKGINTEFDPCPGCGCKEFDMDRMQMWQTKSATYARLVCNACKVPYEQAVDTDTEEID